MPWHTLHPVQHEDALLGAGGLMAWWPGGLESMRQRARSPAFLSELCNRLWTDTRRHLIARRLSTHALGFGKFV